MPLFCGGRTPMMKQRHSIPAQIVLPLVILTTAAVNDSYTKPKKPPGPAPAATILTFDDLPNSTIVTNQYGSKGVSFHSAVVIRESTAHSGDRVLYSGNPVDEFNPGPLIIDFASGQRYVKLYAGTPFSQITGTLTAYDASGNVLVQDGPRDIVRGALTTSMQVTASSAIIRRVELLYPGTAFEIIDDLEFDGDAPPPVPDTAPAVTITAPSVCAGCRSPQTSDANYVIEGNVTGRQLASQAQIKMHLIRPPGSTVTSTYTYPVTLNGTGARRTFTLPVRLGLGMTTITAEAENSGGLRGQASSSIMYLPQAIRDRRAQAADLGTLLFGGGASPTAGCTYAAYTNGTVALVNGQTFVIRGGIHSKWLSLRDPLTGYPRLACPGGEDHQVVAAVGSNGQQFYDGRAQNFPGGRIYAHAAGSYLVPLAFAAAIDQLGGETVTGLPVSDPTSDSRPMFQTWLFQQFRRPS